MSFDYIRNTYKVPAKRGSRVKFKGRPGRVTSADGAYVNLRLDGDDKTTGPYHPTWEMEWLDSETKNPERRKEVMPNDPESAMG